MLIFLFKFYLWRIIMNNFLTKSSAFAFMCLCAPVVFSASSSTVNPTPANLSELVTEVINAPVASLPFVQCTLDFSNSSSITLSTAKIISVLGAERMAGALSMLDVEYLVMEGIAAGARANQSQFGNLASYFADQNAVYNAFAKISGQVSCASQALGVLTTAPGATLFVQNTITNDLPKLLQQLNVSASDTALVNALVPLLSPVFIPMLGNLLSSSYNGLNAAASFIDVNFQKIEDEIASGGCFSCCSKSSSSSNTNSSTTLKASVKTKK